MILKNYKSYGSRKINNYDEYIFSTKELVTNLTISVCLVLLISILFFDNIIASIFISPYILLAMKNIKRKYIKKRKDLLSRQFCDCIEAVGVAMMAGYSVENAFVKVTDEMKNLHGDESMIVDEINAINKKVEEGESIEKSISEFGIRSKVKNIQNFADVFCISKRTEGNIIKICDYTARMIRRNIETERELKTIISGKINELRIMKAMPLISIIYMRMTSKGFYANIYNNYAGLTVMGIFCLLYFAIIFYSECIVQKMDFQ